VYVNERAVLLGKSQSLVGIITEVSAGARKKGKPAFILLNAGFIHRVGPNRLYVHLARRLAAHGFLSVRFDHSGIGDSPPRTDTMNYAESYNSEAQEVMDWLTETKDVDRFCLMGLCSGARTSFSTACKDPRVVGAVLLNARGLSGSFDWIIYVENRWQMKVFLRKLFTPRGFWKTFTGKAPYLSVAKVARNRLKNLFKRNTNLLTGEDSEISNNLNTLIERNFHLLWISSEWDSSREYFKLIMDNGHKSLRFHELVNYEIITEANHSFDSLPAQEQVLDKIEAWAEKCWVQTYAQQRNFETANESTKDY
jgi:pimeloyl-ACP methyl ester carboxylesterase